MPTISIERLKSRFESWGQDQLLIAFIAISLLLHLLAYALPSAVFFQSQTPIIQEWSIETDLVSDFDMKDGSDKTVIEDAVVADQATVPSRLLPQLSKTYEVEDQKQEETSDGLIPDDSVLEGPKKEQQDSAEITKKDEIDKEAIKLKKKEAHKRLVMERLRQVQKEQSNKLQSEAVGDLSRVNDSSQGNTNSGGNIDSLRTNAESQRYQQYLNKIIRRNYSLPNTYKYKQNIKNAHISIFINGRGELVSANIKQSSGDQALDQYCIDAIKRSEPFEIPPDHLISTEITINFSP